MDKLQRNRRWGEGVVVKTLLGVGAPECPVHLSAQCKSQPQLCLELLLKAQS